VGAQANVVGSGDTINLIGNNSVTANGGSDAFVFQPAIGQNTISGFNSSDTMQFSASDFADFTALLDHMSQSGADNTSISLDANDTVSLIGVTPANLVASQFHFA
jgi:hypothetical protein